MNSKSECNDEKTVHNLQIYGMQYSVEHVYSISDIIMYHIVFLGGSFSFAFFVVKMRLPY